MAKYQVIGVMTATTIIGEYEADSKEQAMEMANNDRQGNWYPSVCHQCTREIELSEIHKTYAEKI